MPELTTVNVNFLQPHPANPRTELGDLSELVESIKSLGVLEPVVVVPSHTTGPCVVA